MTDTLNVNVLVAAKEEYSKQLCTCIQNHILDIINEIYNESQLNNLRRKVSFSNFQLTLKEVPNWSGYKLESKLTKINSACPYLMDLITAIFVSHVKILACVRLKKDDKSVKIKVPNLNIFLHKIIITVCESVYYKPNIIHEKEKILDLINTSIMDTITGQIPIQSILNEYLSGVFNEDEDEKEEEEEKLPVIPIEQPIERVNEKPDDSVEELKKELNYIDEIENHKNEPIKIKKRSHIEDDEESDYSNNGDKEEDEDDEKEEDEEDEEDDEDDEEYKDEKKNVETRGKESSLF